MTILPHGGALVDRVLHGPARDAALARAADLPSLTLDTWARSDLELIATGVVSPLTGFMSRRDYRAVVDELRLANGLPWTLPIVLRARPEEVLPLHRSGSGEIALRDARGRIVGLLELDDIHEADPLHEAHQVYGTTDPAHPGVARLLSQGTALLAGDVWLLERDAAPFPELALDPRDTRRLFAERGWRSVVAFQTRNPVHRAHEYIQKAAMELVDGLLLHPLVGETKGDDVPAAVRVRSYRALLDHYYPRDRVLLGAFPAAMRYAGPREAVFHAIARKNFGCTHFIVGRDHAGVGQYYGTYDAQRIFDTFTPDEIGIVPLRYEHTFYCRSCEGMASSRSCPHDASRRVTLSGTAVRELLRRGELPPPEFTRPEVARVLVDALRDAGAAA